MALLRRRVRCHYCNVQSRDSVAQTPRQYHCPHCDAMNYFDERGNITDPPLETVATSLSTAIRYTHTPSRSPSPVMSVNVESPFCDNCQRNQVLVQRLIADYLPDEDDADYAKYETSFDGYRAELEDRYPQVCKKCEARVNDQIRNAGYAAKADNFARMLGKSSEKKRIVPTTRQIWTLKLISLAKWTYILSFLVQVLWHILGYIMAPDQRLWDDENEEYVSTAHVFDADICARQALYVREVDQCCVLGPLVTKMVTYALLADMLTLWWNPKLKHKTNSITGRMRGLKSLWAIRAAVFTLRAGTLFYWQYREVNHETLTTFHNNHLCMLVAMLLSFVLTFKTVRITYLFASSFREKVATANNSPQHARKTSYHPVRPDATAFDTMAHVFTRGFADALDAPACPPSPTLTHSSYTTHATEATTPFGNKTVRNIDDMDWTPTQRKFAAQQPTIHPSPWQKNQQPSPPQTTVHHEPVSLFRKPDPNPFRHKVPAAPKAPAQARADPWKRGVWDPPLKEAAPNFFKESAEERGGVGENKGLDGFGVPKNVKRDAELFASPKFKYDNYGTPKENGLEAKFEDAFNDLFSK